MTRKASSRLSKANGRLSLKFWHYSRQVSDAHPSAHDCSGTHLIDVLACAAQLHVWKELGGKVAIGAAGQLFLENLHGLTAGVIAGEIASKAQVFGAGQ